MRITTLGTSHGNPTKSRFHQSTLVELGRAAWLVDAGSPVEALLWRRAFEFARLRAVFITHAHRDHFSGLPDLIGGMTRYPEKAPRMAVYFPQAGLENPLGAWLVALDKPWPNPWVECRRVAPGLFYEDDLLRVEAEPTRHMKPAADGNPRSWAFTLHAEGRRVVFTGDLSADFSDFPKAARDTPSDLCVCELTHFEPVSALPLLKCAPIRRMVFSHIHDPWHDEGEARAREILASLPYPFEIAHDGDAFEV